MIEFFNWIGNGLRSSIRQRRQQQELVGLGDGQAVQGEGAMHYRTIRQLHGS